MMEIVMRRFIPLLLILLAACQASTATPVPSAMQVIESSSPDAPTETATSIVGSHQATRNAINAENTAIAATNWDTWHPTSTPISSPTPTQFTVQIGSHAVSPEEI